MKLEQVKKKLKIGNNTNIKVYDELVNKLKILEGVLCVFDLTPEGLKEEFGEILDEIEKLKEKETME